MSYEMETVRTGKIELTWEVRKHVFADDEVSYDWIADRANGNYEESDELFETEAEALRDLGVS